MPETRSPVPSGHIGITLACRLTCALAPCLERGLPLGRFPHVMAWCGAAVLRAWRASWAGLSGVRRGGRAGDWRADVPKAPADPGGGEPPRRSGPFPGQAQIVSQRAGEAELGVAGDDQPGPPVSRLGGADLGSGPAEDLLEQAECVFKIKPAEERLPQPVRLNGHG